jgi:selenium-binding protein 1
MDHRWLKSAEMANVSIGPNSLYSTWDDQFYPHQEGGQMVMANVGEDGGLTLDPDFYVNFP